MAEDDDEGAMNLGPMTDGLMQFLLAMKNGQASGLPSEFVLEEEFVDPYTLEEIKNDPCKYTLHCAEHGLLDDLRELVEADSELIKSVDEDGYTALHRASYNNHIRVISYLLDNGADIHATTNDCWTPLHSACRWDNVNVARLLISRGSDVNALTSGGNTVLHLSASHGEADSIIKYLITETEVNLDAVNKAGDTARQVASRNSKLEKLFDLKPETSINPTSNLTTNPTSNLTTNPTSNLTTNPTSNLSIVTEDCSPKSKVVIVPGNGAGDVHRANWYGWLYRKLSKQGRECRLENMPDPITAHQSIWLPYMKSELKCDERTILVGHSSGAAAGLRFAEENKLYALVLVSAYTSDLNDETERESGYFDKEWRWEEIKHNCENIIQFGSSDDPFLPWCEQKQVAENTSASFHQFDNKGHFMSSTFPELLKIVTELQENSKITD